MGAAENMCVPPITGLKKAGIHQSVLRQFFFTHRAEARLQAAGGSLLHSGGAAADWAPIAVRAAENLHHTVGFTGIDYTSDLFALLQHSSAQRTTVKSGALRFFGPFRVDSRAVLILSRAAAGTLRAVFIHSLTLETEIEKGGYQGAGEKQN